MSIPVWSSVELLAKIEKNDFKGMIIKTIRRRKIDALDVKNVLYFFIKKHQQNRWTPIDVKNVLTDIIRKKVSLWRKKWRCEICLKHFISQSKTDSFNKLDSNEKHYLTSPKCKNNCFRRKSISTFDDKITEIAPVFTKNKQYEKLKKNALETVYESLKKMIKDKKHLTIFYSSFFLGDSDVVLAKDFNINRKKIAKIKRSYLWTIEALKQLKMDICYE